jgi:hypothetical protein
MTDFATLAPIEETIEETSETSSITPLNPPTDRPQPKLALHPDTPTDPPSNPKLMGLATLQKIKQKFHFLFK